MQSSKKLIGQFIPVMLCFFAMGFVDLIGTATNYVQTTHHLSDSVAGYLPMMVFVWFLIFSVPTGILMNKIGRKHTVVISLIVTAISLAFPLMGDSLALMIISFCLLGIGNAMMQTSLNPLVSNLISPDKLASTLTFGQFVKAIASFLGPIIATWGATTAFPALGWRVLFAIYAIVCIISILALGFTPIKEEKPDKASGLKECVKLLGIPFVLMCFVGIMCHVGIDVGTNTYAPKLLMQRCAFTLSESTFAISLYFIFRTIGCLAGGFILRVVKPRLFFLLSVVLMVIAMVLMLVSGNNPWLIYVGIALVGFGNSNIFSIIFSQALIAQPMESNEVSGLMIMGLVGGALFPVLMGYATNAVGILGAVGVMSLGVIYLLIITPRLNKA